MQSTRKKTFGKRGWPAVFSASLLAFAPISYAQMEGHDHSTMPDGQGRRLHDMKHEIDDEIGNELREKISVWREHSNAQIALSMQQMGPNYEWYISSPDMRAEQGLLILVHGFRDKGDKVFKETVQPMAGVFPTAIAFGMSMMMSQHIQLGIDDLVAAGAKEIVVVPGVATSHNDMIRQWEYIFGLRDVAEYASVPRIKTDAKIHFTSPPDDDPLIGEIMLDYADELSVNPANEVVIIVAHGPNVPEDNEAELEILESYAKIVREDGGYADVFAATLQDDAPKEIRAANVEKLRGRIEKATAEGRDVLIVTNLMATRGIQAKLRKDLQGLEYKFNSKSMTQHDNYLRWLGTTIDAALRKI